MTQPPRILLVIAHGPLRRSVASHLRNAGEWAVTETADGAEAIGHAGDHTIAVVDEDVLADDLHLRLKEATVLPVILLSSAPSTSHAGIDSVITKPLRLPALVARIRDLMARCDQAGIAVGPWQFDEGRSVLNGDCGALVRLTAKEAAILGRLYRAAGGVVARETLLGEVWGYGAGIDTHTLETHIYKLRRKLGAGVLVSDNGGYRLSRT